MMGNPGNLKARCMMCESSSLHVQPSGRGTSLSLSSRKPGAKALQRSLYTCAHRNTAPESPTDAKQLRRGCQASAAEPSLGPATEQEPKCIVLVGSERFMQHVMAPTCLPRRSSCADAVRAPPSPPRGLLEREATNLGIGWRRNKCMMAPKWPVAQSTWIREQNCSRCSAPKNWRS